MYWTSVSTSRHQKLNQLGVEISSFPTIPLLVFWETIVRQVLFASPKLNKENLLSLIRRQNTQICEINSSLFQVQIFRKKVVCFKVKWRCPKARMIYTITILRLTGYRRGEIRETRDSLSKHTPSSGLHLCQGGVEWKKTRWGGKKSF